MSNSRIYIEAHGCSASYADSEMISGTLEHSGYDIVDEPDDADISILVTCSVKTVTQQRMEHRIKELSKTNSKLIIGGCFPKADKKRVEDLNPNASLIGPNGIHNTLDVVKQTLEGRRVVFLEDVKQPKLLLPRTRKNLVVGIVEISSGCLSACTFCQVKLVKGVLFSYPKQEIINEVKNFVSQGCKEIWLTSTDNSCYGREIKTNLAELLDEVCKIDGDFLVRVGMMNPLLTERILDKLVVSFQNSKVFKFLHLPVQSGSNRILNEMRRGYTVENFLSVVEKFRATIKDLTLSTDIIVGFPGENQTDFDRTLDLLHQVRPDVVNLSRYGARPGTLAASMPYKIDGKEMKRRSSIVSKICREISFERNQRWVGWRGKVLVDEKVRNGFVGRNFAYKPVVVKQSDFEVGQNIIVTISGASSSTLTGTILQ
jgi:threonylcarbamoyladenosine tRNA methylthiotransferase CDKAL1